MADSSEQVVAMRTAERRVGRLGVAVGCYAAAIGGALAIAGALDTTAGAALCALLVVLLLNHHLAALQAGSEPDGIFLILALVPLAGLLAVVMPIAEVIPAAWPLLAAAPTVLAIWLAARELALGRVALGVTLRCPAQQFGIGLLGVPLGYLAWIGLRPPVLDGGTPALAAVSLLALAFAEELLFRGLLQPPLCRLYGVAGIVATAALSAAVALGARSPSYAIFAAMVAGGFGWATRRTGSIAGTTVARALMFVGLLVVWPLVLG